MPAARVKERATHATRRTGAATCATSASRPACTSSADALPHQRRSGVGPRQRGGDPLQLALRTAARADEVQRLNVENIDIHGKCARTRSKGGDIDWLFFGSGSARLLPRLIASRRVGSVFLSSLRPSPGPRACRR